MAYLVDTCVLFEMVAVQPDINVLEWFENQNETSLYVSVVTWGEIQRGIFQLAVGKRRLRLETWLLDELLPAFAGRIIGIDEGLITVWAKMLASYKPKGIVRSSLDSLIEATAVHENLILVTRNVKNFTGSSVSVLNPWNV
jgi:predicted nucleic acid-binding protein